MSEPSIGRETPAATSQEAPANTYRQAARLNRDPFTKESREKQKFLLVSASATIILKLSILKIDSLALHDVKVKLAENSADSVALVLACVAGFYTLAFWISAARDFATDRFRRRAGLGELIAPIFAYLNMKEFTSSAAAAKAETDKLFSLSQEEISSQIERDSDLFESHMNELRAQYPLQEDAARILRQAYKRKTIAEGPQDEFELLLSDWKPYDELKTLDLDLIAEERVALSKVEADLAAIQLRLDTFSGKRHALSEESQRREKAYRDEAFKVLDDWRKHSDATNKEALQMAKAVTSLERYRTASKWIEAVFPCLLGLTAICLEISSLVHRGWRFFHNARPF